VFTGINGHLTEIKCNNAVHPKPHTNCIILILLNINMKSLTCHTKSVFNSLLFISSLFGTQALADSLPEVQDFRIEAKAAKTAQVPILVLFMSDSCHFCEIVLEDFLLPMQRDPAYRNKVILRQIETSSQAHLVDFDGKPTTQSAFAAKHKIWGVPQVFLFDSNGNVLTTLVGLLTVDFYYAYLDDAINNSLAKIRGTAQ
jgi:thioredoxin-related protein